MKARKKEERTMQSLTQLFEEYEAVCLKRTLSKATAYNYRSCTRRYVASLTPPATLPQVTRQTVRRYLLSVVDAHPKAAPLHRAALTHWFTWLNKEGWMSSVPTLNIDLPRPPRSDRRPAVGDEEALRLLLACDRLPLAPFYRIRAKAVVATFVFAGVRRSELLALTPSDVDLDSGLLRVLHGKGDKERAIPVCKELRDALADWRDLRIEDSVHLFCGRKGAALGAKGMTNILDKVCIVAGLPRITSHCFRHGFATRILQNNMPPTVAQQLLGHNQFRTTEIYVHEVETSRLSEFAHLASLKPPAHPQASEHSSPVPGPQANNPIRKRTALRRRL